MFRVYELTNFGSPTCAPTPQLPSAALVGAKWTQISDDPFFAEIDLTAMGYRSAPRGADSGPRRSERRRRSKAFPTSSMDALRGAFRRFGGGNRRRVGAGAEVVASLLSG
jgi:hypothetical protein